MQLLRKKEYLMTRVAGRERKRHYEKTVPSRMTKRMNETYRRKMSPNEIFSLLYLTQPGWW